MGKINSKQKGARGEREIANILTDFGFNAHRGVQYQGSPESPDVVGLPHIHIEVKRVEKLNIYKAMLQSFKDASEDELPAVFHRRNNEEWLVTMSLGGWIKLYRGWLDELSSDERVL